MRYSRRRTVEGKVGGKILIEMEREKVDGAEEEKEKKTRQQD